MLSHLYIRNYALITELDVDFQSGMTVITGETGAGKSIILGALGLIMGNRADTKVITEGEKKCIIEATFQLPQASGNDAIEQLFNENDIDFFTATTLRRELTDTGKSRAFINDSPVQLSTLKAIAELLIDIHSQHENLAVRDRSFQLSVVDAVADNKELRLQYSTLYRQLCETESELAKLSKQASANAEETDYLSFQLSQLEDAKLQNGEDSEIEEELTRLTHAEDIQRALYQTSTLLDDTSAIGQVNEAVGQLRTAAKYLSKAEDLSERLHSTLIEMKDIRDEAQRLSEQTEYNPERQAWLEQRLNTINSLLLKHRKNSVDELISLRDEISARLSGFDSLDEQIDNLTSLFNQQKNDLDNLAGQLTQSRQAACPALSKQVTDMLSQLGMHNAKVEFSLSATPDFTPSGKDTMDLLFAANKNQSLSSISRVASGGEMARLMLCLKAILTREESLGTIIFDEIDTGVSGEVASNMGDIISQMARDQQIIVITHLPQIAAKGTHHLKVYKQDNPTRTETHLVCLTSEQRIKEIATLLSGDNITKAAIDNAKELLKRQDK